MAQRLHLELVTQSAKILDTEVSSVQLPGSLGELGVLPAHTSLLTSLGTGELSYIDGDGGGPEYLAIQHGFAEILDDRVTVLANSAERPQEIDIEAAEQDRARSVKELETAGADDFDQLNDDLDLANTRIQVASRVVN